MVTPKEANSRRDEDQEATQPASSTSKKQYARTKLQKCFFVSADGTECGLTFPGSNDYWVHYLESHGLPLDR